MKKGILLVCLTLLSLLGLKAQDMPIPSTEGNTVWYYIKFLNGSSVISDQGSGNKLVTAQINNGEQATADQLWKLQEVSGGSGTYIFISMLGNKIVWNNQRYYADQNSGVAMIFVSSINTLYQGGWELFRSTESGVNTMGQNISAGYGAFITENEFGNDRNPLVFIAATEIEVNSAEAAIERILVQQAQERLLAAIESANEVLYIAVEGTDPGQYPADKIADLANAASTAQAVNDNPLSTADEMNNAASTLNSVFMPFLSSVNKPFMVSTPGVQEYYYAIYTPNKDFRSLTCSTDSTALITTVNNDESVFLSEGFSSYQKWIIIQLTDETYAIVNPATINTNLTEDVYISNEQVESNSTILTTTTPVTNSGWQIQNGDELAKNGPLFIIVNNNKMQLYNSSNELSDVTNYGYGVNNAFLNAANFNVRDDGSNYKFLAVGSKTFVGLKQIETDAFRVIVSYGVITVPGVDKFEVYSIDGQQQNVKSVLQNGIYLVKVSSQITKVVVK